MQNAEKVFKEKTHIFSALQLKAFNFVSLQSKVSLLVNFNLKNPTSFRKLATLFNLKTNPRVYGICLQI